jgi:hypothetical protein
MASTRHPSPKEKGTRSFLETPQVLFLRIVTAAFSAAGN